MEQQITEETSELKSTVVHQLGEYIVAEFCHADIYNGWHLYRRESIDGLRNRDGDWGWFQGALSIGRVREFCLSLGFSDEEMPEVHYRYGSGKYQQFVNWFAGMFPLGLKVQRGGWGDFRQEPLSPAVFPEREVIQKVQRLYWFYANGKPYATLAQTTDDAWQLFTSHFINPQDQECAA